MLNIQVISALEGEKPAATMYFWLWEDCSLILKGYRRVLGLEFAGNVIGIGENLHLKHSSNMQEEHVMKKSAFIISFAAFQPWKLLSSMLIAKTSGGKF